jgi:hypothetical protein
MQGDLKLCGFCENTRRTYIRCAARFSQHYGKSPSKLGRAEIRAYLLYLIEEKKLSASTYNVYAAALAFLYRETLERPQCHFSPSWVHLIFRVMGPGEHAKRPVQRVARMGVGVERIFDGRLGVGPFGRDP